MPMQAPEERTKNLNEVAEGFTEEMAVREALRCLQCREHPCMTEGCPVSNHIPDFIRKYRETAAPLIIGARDYREIPLRRRIPNLIGKTLFSAAVGQNIPDNQSGYRMLDRTLMERMLLSSESGYHFEVEMIAVCIAEKWPVEWVRIPTIYGDEVSKQNPLDQIFGFPKMCMKARRMIREKQKETCSRPK